MKKEKNISLVIADDHPLFRAGVRAELERIPHFKLLAETCNGEEALQLIQQHKPDVAVVDYQMPKLTGLELARKLEEAGTSTRIIVLTMHRDQKIFFAALEAGVSGYVLKDDAVADIVRAVTDVANGETFISKDMTRLLIDKAANRPAESSIHKQLQELTAAERKILVLIADLKSNEEIAETLFISKRTVENHKVAIADKLGLDSSKRLLRFALQNKDAL
jgi:DNA-binding NarL/FixJ family response regulator